jgi:hypothetical protein
MSLASLSDHLRPPSGLEIASLVGRTLYAGLLFAAGVSCLATIRFAHRSAYVSRAEQPKYVRAGLLTAAFLGTWIVYRVAARIALRQVGPFTAALLHTYPGR